jgi:N-acetyl-alpha-D-muramate 1-phosphate uridylyltransferase
MPDMPLMIFAAGLGTRMGQITQTTPKPLIRVAGRALIDHALDVARAAGVGRIVINLHHLGEQIERHLTGQDITLLWERPQRLETGGGFKAALPYLGQGPVLLLNSDAVWSGANPLLQLLAHWDSAKMDALLLLTPQARALGHAGGGDFHLHPDGRLDWDQGGPGPVYLGAQIMQAAAVRDYPETVFSLVKIWTQLIAQRSAYGLMHQGGWCDVGTMQGLALAEEMLHV